MKFDMYVKNIKNMYSINFQISCPTKKIYKFSKSSKKKKNYGRVFYIIIVTMFVSMIATCPYESSSSSFLIIFFSLFLKSLLLIRHIKWTDRVSGA